MTHNEPWAISVNIYGSRPKTGHIDVYTAGHNLLLAHAKTYRLYQRKYKATQNGIKILHKIKFTLCVVFYPCAYNI